MDKKFLTVFLAALVILPLAFFGCKSKVEKTAETPQETMPEVMPAIMQEAVTTPEPAQTVATETIPPTAAPQVSQITQAIKPMALEREARNRDIQKALKAAGFYVGAIDGKIGPRTKRAVEEFQKAKGLKVDGKVGPKTWAELEKYLISQ